MAVWSSLCSSTTTATSAPGSVVEELERGRQLYVPESAAVASE